MFYTRVALYGVDFLLEEKQRDWDSVTEINEETIRLREEIALQMQALRELIKLGELYGVDLSRPAMDTKEAINGPTWPSWRSVELSMVPQHR